MGSLDCFKQLGGWWCIKCDVRVGAERRGRVMMVWASGGGGIAGYGVVLGGRRVVWWYLLTEVKERVGSKGLGGLG